MRIRRGDSYLGAGLCSCRGFQQIPIPHTRCRGQYASTDKFPSNWRHRCLTLITGSITGLPGYPVRDVTLRNVSIVYGGIGATPKPDHIRLDKLVTVPECAANYPESRMFGTLPFWGLYCRHAEGIKFDNVTLQVKGTDYRAALVCDDVKNLSLTGLRVLSAGTEPVIVLHDVHGATIRDSVAPPKAGRTAGCRGSALWPREGHGRSRVPQTSVCAAQRQWYPYPGP